MLAYCWFYIMVSCLKAIQAKFWWTSFAIVCCIIVCNSVFSPPCGTYQKVTECVLSFIACRRAWNKSKHHTLCWKQSKVCVSSWMWWLKVIRHFNLCEWTVTSRQAGFDLPNSCLSKIIGGKIDHSDMSRCVGWRGCKL